MKIVAFAVLASFVFSLEASERVLYEEITYNKPELRQEAEAYLGDRMLTQQVGAWKECLTPRQTYSKTRMGQTASYRGGEPICKTELKSKKYFPTYEITAGVAYSVRWKEKGKNSSICACQMGLCGMCVKKLPANAVDFGETFIYRPNSFQQVIEYAGMSENNLKFAYSEFTGGFLNQSYTREFQVDLAEGNVAAYKGAIIEIIEATNIQIKYRVIRNFAAE